MNENLMEIKEILYECINLSVDGYSIRRILPVGQGFVDYDKKSISKENYLKVIQDVKRICEKNNLKFHIHDPVLFPVLGIAQSIEKKYKTNQIIAGCGAGIVSCHIDNVGHVSPCALLPVDCGNIRKHSFKNIWESSDIFGTLRNRIFSGKCNSCHYRYICGGCRSSAFSFSGNIMGCDPFCLLNIGE